MSELGILSEAANPPCCFADRKWRPEEMKCPPRLPRAVTVVLVDPGPTPGARASLRGLILCSPCLSPIISLNLDMPSAASMGASLSLCPTGGSCPEGQSLPQRWRADTQVFPEHGEEGNRHGLWHLSPWAPCSTSQETERGWMGAGAVGSPRSTQEWRNSQWRGGRRGSRGLWRELGGRCGKIENMPQTHPSGRLSVQMNSFKNLN